MADKNFKQNKEKSDLMTANPMYVQYVEHMKMSIEDIKNMLENKSGIENWAYIYHDKDKGKKPHYHVMMRLKSTRSVSDIAKWFGDEMQYIEVYDKGKGGYKNGFSYLIHATQNAIRDGKFQYPCDEVVANFDYAASYSYDPNIADRKNKKIDPRLIEIIENIDNGNIREYNYFQYITMLEYTKYKRQIDMAFKYRTDRLKGANREMECIFIQGDSGTGKSTYAKELCENKNMSFFVSSGSNDPLDDYAGQEAIILDDLRGSSIRFSDLLKMLDNHTASSVTSRYKNKVLTECKLIIITTVKSIDDFFHAVFESDTEPVHQLKRRCKTLIKLDKQNMYVYGYYDKSREYIKVGTYKNPCVYLDTKETEEDLRNSVAAYLGVEVNHDNINDDEFYPCDQIEIPFD